MLKYLATSADHKVHNLYLLANFVGSGASAISFCLLVLHCQTSVPAPW